MRRGFFNIRTILIVVTLTTVFLLTGCGKGGSSGAADLSEDFFTGKLSGEITVSAYNPMYHLSYLEEAARLFEERYPGVKVNIETFSAMPEMKTMELGDAVITVSESLDDTPQSRADYLNRVYTRIMSGTGADIYAMDIIPLVKFIESGNLENLDSYMNGDPDFNRADYRRNIIEALRYRGGVWFLPMDYTFRHYSYDSSLVPAELAAAFGVDKAWSAEGLFSLGITLYDGTHKLFNLEDYISDGQAMFTLFLNEGMQSFVNMETKRANFADGRFSELLRRVKSYGEDGLLRQGITGMHDAADIMQRMTEAPTERFFFKLDNSLSLQNKFIRSSGMPIWGWGSSGGIMSVDDDDKIAGIEAMADGSVSFRCSKGYGINSQSKNKALAWAFLRFLLSEEMQFSWELIGFPLNNNAREEKMEFEFTGFGMNELTNDRQRQGLEDYKAAVERLSDSINTFVTQDTNVNDMIASEVQYYFNGSRSADEVARVLQNKVDLYLSE